jgi:hypothetical protein
MIGAMSWLKVGVVADAEKAKDSNGITVKRVGGIRMGRLSQERA